MQLAEFNVGVTSIRSTIRARFDHLNQYGDSDHAFGWSYAPQARLWLETRCA